MKEGPNILFTLRGEGEERSKLEVSVCTYDRRSRRDDQTKKWKCLRGLYLRDHREKTVAFVEGHDRTTRDYRGQLVGSGYCFTGRRKGSGTFRDTSRDLPEFSDPSRYDLDFTVLGGQGRRPQ